ncbi:TetR/AcrR family transcriptional regulator [Gordonia sinesedis]
MSKTSRRSRSPRGSGELLAVEIIDATTRLLTDSDDVSAVSIRAVADRVGVTPPAIYLHFADKEALLDAVCARYFEQLDTRMALAVDDVADPVERLLRQGMEYVRFALSNPVVYRQAFARTAAAGTSKIDTVLTAAAFVRFADSVAELAAAGLLDAGEVDDVVLQLWTLAHGIASLMIVKPYLTWGDELDFAERTLRSAFLGRIASDALAGPAPADVPGLLTVADRIRTDSGADSLVKKR